MFLGIISSLLIPLLIVGVVFYFIQKSRKSSVDDFKHTYYYFVSFVTFVVLYFAISELTRLFLNYWFLDKYTNNYQIESFLRQVAGRLAALLVALPVWAFHWMQANPPGGEYDRHSKKIYSLVFVVLLILVIIVGWSFILYYLITWALGVSESSFKEETVAILSYVVPGTILWFWNFRIWRKLSEEERSDTSVSNSTIKNP